MKVLLKNHGGKKYVWVEAEWEAGRYYELHTWGRGYYIDQINIIAVTDDNRIGYVQCRNCGALIKNTPEAIEEHFKEKEKDRNCLECKYLSIYGDKRNVKKYYVVNDNGSHSVTETYDAQLGCKKTYYTHPLGSAETERRCIYRQCRIMGVTEINDIFVKYPNVFDRYLTVDALIEKKYAYEGYVDGYFVYDLKCRGSLKALVNEKGIVECYKVSTRGWDYYMAYSAIHNKIFITDGYYRDDISNYLSDSKKEMILKRLQKLYEEVTE